MSTSPKCSNLGPKALLSKSTHNNLPNPAAHRLFSWKLEEGKREVGTVSGNPAKRCHFTEQDTQESHNYTVFALWQPDRMWRMLHSLTLIHKYQSVSSNQRVNSLQGGVLACISHARVYPSCTSEGSLLPSAAGSKVTHTL